MGDNPFEQLGALQAQGMAIVEGGAGMSYTDIMRYGYSRDQAKDLKKLAQVYYRRTNYSRVQAASVAAAHATAKSLDELLLIEKQVKKLKNKKNAWPMRKALTAVRGHAGDIRREAKRLIEAWNPHVDEDTDATPKAHFCDVKNTLRRKLVLEADEHTLRQKELEARKLAQKCGITLGEAVVKLLVEGGPVAPARTTIIVGLEAGTKIERGEGDDIIVGLTDGSRLTGAQLAERAFLDAGHVVLVHPVEGAVDVYRFKRTATVKQRIMAKAESPMCAWPGCTKPADECEINHNIPWKAGGPTNIANLSPLCAFHNGWAYNPRHGRLVKIRGVTYRIPPPGGGPKHRNEHPVAMLGAMAWV